MVFETKMERSIPIYALPAMLMVLLALNIPEALCQRSPTPDYNALSQQFLENIREGKDSGWFQSTLENTTLQTLARALATDHQKIAFWVNVYNGYIQLILSKNPERYKNRDEFFKSEQIPVAGRKISFAQIEHGILRKSQWELGLGYFRKWFPDEFERELRVEDPDYRIHFALNCGAKSCPPIAIYQPAGLNKQLNTATRSYLKRTSTFNKEDNEVVVTALFKWFRGDFNGSNGIRRILVKFGVIASGANVELTYAEYDWTLDLDNFTSF
jgi:hypothetical protein